MNDPLASLPSLVLLSGAETGRRIPLTTGEKAVLGRSLEADLTFPDEPSLSRLHARIEHEGDHYTITDLGSVNGTQVNGKDIPQQQPTILSHRDVIACGELELRFELPESQRAGAGSRTMVMTRPEEVESLPRVRAILATENRPTDEADEGEGEGEAQAGEEAAVDEEPLVAASEAEAEIAAHGAPPEDEASAAVPDFDAPLEEEDLGAAVALAQDEDAVALAPEIELPASAVHDHEQPLASSQDSLDAEDMPTPSEEPAQAVAPEEGEPAVPFAGMSEEAEVGPVVPVDTVEPETAAPAITEQEPEPVMAAGGAPPAAAEQSSLETAVKALPLFRRLSEEQIQGLVQSMSQREFAPGAEIVRQGEEGLSLYIVLAGEVRVQRAGPGGDLDLAAIGPGGFFGEMTLLDGEPRSATVRAVTPVRCALLPRWGLEATIRANPSVAMEMLAVLSRRLRATEGLLTA